jgi:hypothetical protein
MPGSGSAGAKFDNAHDGLLDYLALILQVSSQDLAQRVFGHTGLNPASESTFPAAAITECCFPTAERYASRLSNAAGGALRSLKAAKDYALVVSPAALARDEMHARSGSAMRDRVDQP